MEKIAQYQKYIQSIILDHAAKSSSNDGVESQTIFDTERHHYQLMYVGWHREKRVYGVVLHFDIKDEKIWIQWNGTEDPVGERLAEMGVPKSDIVVGFHSPFTRQFTEFAIG